MPDQIGLTAKLTFDGSQAIQGMEKTGVAFAGMQQKIAVAKGGFTQVKAGLAGLKIGGLLAGVGIGASVKGFIHFDEVMAGVRAQLGEGARKDFPMLSAAARDMGTKTGKSAVTVAEAMKALAEKGLSANEIMTVLPSTLDGMKASGSDAATAAATMVDTYRKFGLEAGQAGGAMDVITAAAQRGGMGGQIPAFAQALQMTAGTASLLKLDIKDVAAGVAMFTKGGMDAGGAAMNFNMALLKLSRASKDGFINIAGLGKVEVATKNGAMDLQTTMTNIAVALKYVKDPMQRVNLAMSLFGMRGRESANALEKLTADPAALPAMFDAIKNKSTGATAAMAKLRSEGPGQQFKKLQHALSNVSMEIGAAFVPFVEKAVKVIVPMARGFAEAFRFFSASPAAINQTNVAIAGVSPTITAMAQGLMAGFAGVKDAFGWLGSGIKMVGGLFGGGGPGGSGVKTAVEWAVKLGVVAGAYKLLAGPVKSVMNVGIGGAKMLLGSLQALGSGATGLLGMVSKRFPAVARMLPKGAGALGKALGAAEKITAQPVRIVNWDEAGMGAGLGGAGAKPGAPTLPGAGGARPAIGMGVGIAAAVGGGIALNLIKGEAREPVKTLGNTVLGISAMFGPVGMAVGGMAAGALAFGSKIDEWTGASDWISKSLWSAGEGARAIDAQVKRERYQKDLNWRTMQDQANALLGFAQKGTAVDVGAGKQAVTEDFMRERLTRYTEGMVKSKGMTPEEAKVMVKSMMDEMAPKLADAMQKVKLETTVNVDGRPVAKGVAGATQENKERRGEPQAPGARRRAKS